METWAEQLEDALPKANHAVIGELMREYCPSMLLGEEAPEYKPSVYVDDAECVECWESCDHFCKHLRGKRDEKC